MAGAYRLHIEVDPVKAVQGLNATAVAFGRNDWLDRLGDAWLSSIERTVATGGGGRRTPWKPFAPATIAAGGGTGTTLLAGFRKTVERTGGFVSRVSVSHPEKKAYWFERGTPPKTIEPTGGRKFLVFQTERGTVFARKVEHPRVPGRRLLPARRAAFGMFKSIVQASVEATLKQEGLSGG
jgi:hypothetical protein